MTFIVSQIVVVSVNRELSDGSVNWPHVGRGFRTPEVGIIGIFVLLKYENELELVTIDISFNSISQ